MLSRLIFHQHARRVPRLRASYGSAGHTQQIKALKHANLRCFSTSPLSLSSSVKAVKSQNENDTKAVYHGPLTKTFRSLKIFSVSSMGLAMALTPFMFIIQTSLPNVARFALAATALTTSGISTALVAWCGKPYVARAYPIEDGKQENEAQTSQSLVNGIKLETLDIFLRPRFTNVYDTSFLAETRRPFAKWELAETLSVRKPDVEDVPAEETIAETLSADGRVLGRWIVSWDESRTSGVCRREGKVQRYFNVHEELMPRIR